MAKKSKPTFATFDNIEDAAAFVKTTIASPTVKNAPDFGPFCKAAFEFDVEKLGELAEVSRPTFDLAAKKIHKAWASAIEIGCDFKKAAGMGLFLLRQGASIVDAEGGRSAKPFMVFAANELKRNAALQPALTENMRKALRETFAIVCNQSEWSWKKFLGDDPKRLCEDVPGSFLPELARIGSGGPLEAFWPDICLSKAIAIFEAEVNLEPALISELFDVLFAKKSPTKIEARKYCAFAILHDSADGLLILSNACPDFDWTVDSGIASDFQDDLVSPCGSYSALHYCIFAHQASGRGANRTKRECFKLLSRFEPARKSALKNPWPESFCIAGKPDLLDALSNNPWLLRPEGMQGRWARTCAEYMEENFCTTYLALCGTPFEADLTCENQQGQSALSILLSHVREDKKDAFLAKISAKQRKSLAEAAPVPAAKTAQTKTRI